jgi:hypothetical protein
MYYKKTLPNKKMYHEFLIQCEKIVLLLYYPWMKKNSIGSFYLSYILDCTVLLWGNNRWHPRTMCVCLCHKFNSFRGEEKQFLWLMDLAWNGGVLFRAQCCKTYWGILVSIARGYFIILFTAPTHCVYRIDLPIITYILIFPGRCHFLKHVTTLEIYRIKRKKKAIEYLVLG